MPLGLPAWAFLSVVFTGWGVPFPMVSQDSFFVLLGWYPQRRGSPVPLLPGILELAVPLRALLEALTEDSQPSCWWPCYPRVSEVPLPRVEAGH